VSIVNDINRGISEEMEQQLLANGWTKEYLGTSAIYTKPVPEETKRKIAQIAAEMKRKGKKSDAEQSPESRPPLTEEERKELRKKLDERLLPHGWTVHDRDGFWAYSKPVPEETKQKIAQIAEESKRNNRRWLWWRRNNK